MTRSPDTTTAEARNGLRAQRSKLTPFERIAFDNRWVNHNDNPVPLGLVLVAYESVDRPEA